MKLSIATCSLVLAFVCLLSFNADIGSEAASTSYYTMAKEYMVKMFNDKILSKSETVVAFRATMAKINERYEADVKAGKINEADQAEASAAYHKILIEEIKRFRETLVKPADEAHIDELEAQLCSQDKLMDACNRMASNDGAKPTNEMQALTEDQMREEEEELELEEKKSQIEKENEMGWSLTPEAKEALKVRTRQVLSELLNNEVRQLALAVLQAYMAGGTIGPIIIAMSGVLKTKVVQYFMQIIMDMLSSAMGSKITIDPAQPIQPAPVQPAPVPVAA